MAMSRFFIASIIFSHGLYAPMPTTGASAPVRVAYRLQMSPAPLLMAADTARDRNNISPMNLDQVPSLVVHDAWVEGLGLPGYESHEVNSCVRR